MRNINVESQGIRQIAYDLASQILQISFIKGETYQYFGVSPQEYALLMNSPSHGKFFNKNIRNQFVYRKIAA